MPLSPFDLEEGQEVAILDGPEGRPMRLSRVAWIRRMPRDRVTMCDYGPGARSVKLECGGREFTESALGFSRGRGRTRDFLVPATEEHRLQVRRAGQLALLQQSQARFKDLPSPALEEILRTLDSYLPGGVGRVDPSRIVPMGTMK